MEVLARGLCCLSFGKVYRKNDYGLFNEDEEEDHEKCDEVKVQDIFDEAENPINMIESDT